MRLGPIKNHKGEEKEKINRIDLQVIEKESFKQGNQKGPENRPRDDKSCHGIRRAIRGEQGFSRENKTRFLIVESNIEGGRQQDAVT